MVAPMKEYYPSSIDGLTLSEAAATFASDLEAVMELPLPPRDPSSRKRSGGRSSSLEPKRSKTTSRNHPPQVARGVIPSSTLTSISASSSLFLSRASFSQSLVSFSSSLATYANANPYEPIPDPKLPSMDSAPANATLAMLQSFRLKGLEVPSASYSVKEMSVGFPGMVGGVPGTLATKIIDSLPRAKDWRSLN